MALHLNVPAVFRESKDYVCYRGYGLNTPTGFAAGSVGVSIVLEWVKEVARVGSSKTGPLNLDICKLY